MKHLYLSTAIALVASPALAEITPEELFASWQKITAEMGGSLSAGQQERQGNVLVLRDVKTTADFGFFSFEQTIAQMRLGALDDGSVSVSYDSDFTAIGSMSFPNIPANNISFTGLFEATEGTATGTPDDYIYDFSVGVLQMTGATIMGVEGSTDSETTSESRTTDLKGRIRFISTDAGVDMSYAFTIAGVESSQSTTVELAGTDVKMKQSQRSVIEGYDAEINVFIPNTNHSADRGAFIPEGLTLQARLGISSLSVSQKTTSPYFNMDIAVAQGSGETTLNIDENAIALASNSQDTIITVTSPALGPQPFSTKIADGDLAISLPYRPREATQDASFDMRLEGITANEAIWALLDPENTLSRAPFDFAISTEASLTLRLDWTNIDAIKSWQGVPAYVHSIELKDFLVGFGDARIEGEGTVGISNFTPMPTPRDGALSFTLTGIPALLEKLGNLPLVDLSLIIGALGMLDVFTIAGEGDTLTSIVEFDEFEGVTINGQRLR